MGSRVFYEAFPILSLMAYHSLVCWIGLPLKAKEDPAAMPAGSGGQVLQVVLALSAAVLLILVVRAALVAFVTS